MIMKFFVAMSILLVSGVTYSGEPPASIQALSSHGVDVVDSFDAPGDLQGYVMSFQGRHLTAFVTPGQQYVIVGTLMNADGEDLSATVLNAMAAGDNASA